ncbi:MULTISPECIES: hypothetical protein [unclassified Pseudomonas]|uniref:hypothetical protein n=1 Tax=unclassified Pseudomonas TaxID=196821 RepID=UPI0039B74A17
MAKPGQIVIHLGQVGCHFGARMVFVEDLALREHLQSLASEEGFALDEESIFTITTTLRDIGNFARKDHRRR